MIDSQPETSGLSFIHIPKNAGTSVRQAIADNSLPIRVIGHPYPRKLSEQEIVVLRCPFGRFASAFRYGRKCWPSPVNAQFADANELASSAADPQHPKHELAWVELGNKPDNFVLRSGKACPQHTVANRVTEFTWAYEPQSTWLINDPRHILRYRHVSEDFSTLMDALGFPRLGNLPRTNQSEGADEKFSADARAFIEATYRADFSFIRSSGLDV